jgi:hypothetical protein
LNSNNQARLGAGAVDALDENAFDIGGFGGAGDPDEVGVVGHGGEGVDLELNTKSSLLLDFGREAQGARL